MTGFYRQCTPNYRKMVQPRHIHVKTMTHYTSLHSVMTSCGFIGYYSSKVVSAVALTPPPFEMQKYINKRITLGMSRAILQDDYVINGRQGSVYH